MPENPLCIRNWNDHYETSASRKLDKLNWVAIPNAMDQIGYITLVDHPNGAAHFGAWIAIVEIASRQGGRNSRGVLPGGEWWETGRISQHLGRISRLPTSLFEEVLPRLQVEPIQWLAPLVADSTNRVAENPNRVAESTATVQPTNQPNRTLFPSDDGEREPVAGISESELCAVEKQMHHRHPAIRRCGMGEIRKNLLAILRKHPKSERAALLGRIDKAHATLCATDEWTEADGKFSKGLANWLAPTKMRWAEAPDASAHMPAARQETRPGYADNGLKYLTMEDVAL